MERYLGIDVHAESCTAVVLSSSGRKIEEARLETNGEALVGFVRKTPGQVKICIEEGEWSQWLVEILSPHGAEVVAYRPQWRPGVKNDRIDAHSLAEALRTGRIGCPVYKAPRRWAKLRELVRLYEKLTRDVVRSKQRLRSPWVEQLPVALRPAAKLQAQELDCQKDIRAEVEAEMLTEARRWGTSKSAFSASQPSQAGSDSAPMRCCFVRGASDLSPRLGQSRREKSDLLRSRGKTMPVSESVERLCAAAMRGDESSGTDLFLFIERERFRRRGISWPDSYHELLPPALVSTRLSAEGESEIVRALSEEMSSHPRGWSLAQVVAAAETPNALPALARVLTSGGWDRASRSECAAMARSLLSLLLREDGSLERPDWETLITFLREAQSQADEELRERLRHGIAMALRRLREQS